MPPRMTRARPVGRGRKCAFLQRIRMANSSKIIHRVGDEHEHALQRIWMTASPKKIQLVEDDLEIAKLIAEELAGRGFEVLVAHNGHEGFVSILKNTPDLVLCDISMPTMSGFEILEALSNLAPRIGHIPFVFLSALTDRDVELRARRLGADDFVAKPIDFDI